MPEKPYSFEASLPAVQKLQSSGGNDTFEHTSRAGEMGEKKSIENITQLKSSYVLKNKPIFVSILNLPFFKWNCNIYKTLAWEAVFCRIGGI